MRRVRVSRRAPSKRYAAYPSVGPTAIIAWIASIVAVGCTTDSVIAGAGLPGTTQSATITDVSTRYEYIDAFVTSGADSLVLIDGTNLCPIVGFAQPLSGS